MTIRVILRILGAQVRAHVQQKFRAIASKTVRDDWDTLIHIRLANDKLWASLRASGIIIMSWSNPNLHG
jgi:hypothetical protein